MKTTRYLFFIALIVACVIAYGFVLFVATSNEAEASHREAYKVWTKIYPHSTLSYEEWTIARRAGILPK